MAVAKGFDELITFLLEAIALCGEQGTTVEEIIDNIFVFYKDSETGAQEAGGAVHGEHNKVPGVGQSLQFTVDRPFLECAWRWLTSHPDVYVGMKRQANRLSLSEIENLPLEPRSSEAAQHDQTPQPSSKQDASKRRRQQTSSPAPAEVEERPDVQPKIFVSQERMWYALTGHGIDWKRIPYLEFVILSLIGASKRKGIIQPELVKLSAQDKRSVPKRTAALVTKGYIEKASTLAKGSHTSLCILKKFAGTHDAFRRGLEGATKENPTAEAASRVDELDIAQFVQSILETLRNKTLVTREELKHKQGTIDRQAHRRVFFRVLRELEELGIVRHVSGSFPNSATPKSFCTCLKLLREPEPSEISDLLGSAPSLFRAMYDPNMDEMEDHVFSGSADDGGAEVTFRTADDEDEIMEDEADQMQLVELERILPYWSPSQPLPNMLFDVTDFSGLEGANTMLLKSKGMGQFFLRPLEQLLDRLSERWQLAQPPHVRHLSLIRDTEQLLSVSCYKYFTYENFSRLVDMGNADWEAVGVQPAKDKGSGPTGPLSNGSHDFSTLTASKFVGNGDKSLSECLQAAKIPFFLTRLDAVLEKAENGQYSLNWAGRGADGTPSVPLGRPPRSDSSLRQVVQVDPDAPRKPLGRPRKYAKGEEPYSRENKAKLRAEKKAAAEALAKGRAERLAAAWAARRAQKAAGEHQSQEPEEESQQPANDQDGARLRTPSDVEVESPLPPRSTVTRRSRTRGSNAQDVEEADTIVLASPTPEVQDEPPLDNVNGATPQPASETGEADQLSCPGIYINPPGSARPKVKGRGRPRRAIIAVFKSPRLRDLGWFCKTNRSVRFATPIAAEERPSSPLPTNEPRSITGKRPGVSLAMDLEPAKRRRGRPSKQSSPDSQPQPSKGSSSSDIAYETSPSVTTTTENSNIRPLFISDFLWLGSLAASLQSRSGAWDKSGGLYETPTILSATSHRVPEPLEPSPKRRKVIAPVTPRKSQRQAKGSPAGHKDSPRPKRRAISPQNEQVNAESPVRQITPSDAGRTAESGLGETQVGTEDGTREQPVDRAQATQAEAATSRETPVDAIQESQTIEYESGDLPTLLEERTKFNVRDDSKITLGGGTVGFQRSKIILEILEKCGGAYPGNLEIIYPFLTAWVKLGRAEPDRLTVQKAVKNLVDSGKIKKLKFVFRDKKGTMATKDILIKPEVSPNSAVVRNIQENMIKADPWLHLPEGAEIAEKYQKRIIQSTRQIAMRQIGEKKRTGDKSRTRKRGNVWKMKNGFSGEDEDRMRAEIEALEASVNAEQGALAEKIAQLEALKRNIAFGSPDVTESRDQAPQPTNARARSRLYRLQRPQRPTGPGALEDGDQQQPLPIDPALLALSSETTSLADSAHRQQTFTEKLASLHRERRRKSLADPALKVAPVRGRSQGDVSAKRPLPTSLEDLMERCVKRRRRAYQPALQSSWRKFAREVETVQAWEIENPTIIDQRRDGWHFINHKIPDQDTLVSVPSQRLQIVFQSGHPEPDLAEAGSDDERSPTPAEAWERADFEDVTASGREQMRPPRLIPSKPSSRNKRQLTTRRLTSLAEKAAYDAKVNLGVLEENDSIFRSRRVRGPNSDTALSPEMEHKLLTAVIVVRTLTGGLERNIDWIIVSRIFEPEYPQRFIQQRWSALQPKYRLHIDNLQSEFQEVFAQAYEEDRVPRIDYDNLLAYDWSWLVSWAQRALDLQNVQGPPDLPDNRKRLDDMYEVRDLPDNASTWREEFTSQNVTMLKRISTVKSVPFTLPFATSKLSYTDKGEEEKQREMEQKRSLARSWVRANIFTYPEIYNPDKAREKFLGISSDLLDKAVHALLQERSIIESNKGRLVPGRNYDISDHFLKSSRKTLEENHFVRAVAFKHILDQAFADKGSIDFSYHAEDGDVMAVINLLANGRVRLVPKNPPMNKFGLTDGGYRTRFMQKSRLIFDVEVRPSTTYIQGLPLEPLPPPPMDEFAYQSSQSQDGNTHDTIDVGQVPTTVIAQGQIAASQQKRIPFWVDIHENFNPVMWRLALAAVLSIMALRPGINVRQLHTATRPCFDEWELQLLLEWLVEAKAARKVGMVASDGDGEVGAEAIRSLNRATTAAAAAADATISETGYAPEEWWWTVLRPEPNVSIHHTAHDLRGHGVAQQTTLDNPPPQREEPTMIE
ncbi:hypothetical protein L228DRAFT_279731 [Xylona heveae TC161]|uniref:Uncharacterized protein n=1 Tax=Xylona heveae (strain CBS 132557 / TC161) TaxID=1328760 RepID=A0A165JRS8_XYLHT|nr:hypothetical protein L228DRAFT_279731 [Xylona heveae TC161]KZF26551.1 hypothetical protein L228DRAFT_279731 [Xylona heveae TC161]